MGLWRSSMMSMTSCSSARSSLRAWGVYEQNCCALKISTITPTVTPNSPNKLHGLSIRQIPAVCCRSHLSFTLNDFPGVMAKSHSYGSLITKARSTSFLNGSKLQQVSFMSTSGARSTPNRTCSSLSTKIKSLKSIATKLQNPKKVNDVMLHGYY